MTYSSIAQTIKTKQIFLQGTHLIVAIPSPHKNIKRQSLSPVNK